MLLMRLRWLRWLSRRAGGWAVAMACLLAEDPASVSMSYISRHTSMGVIGVTQAWPRQVGSGRCATPVSRR